ncbi:FAD-binding oxidoreductase [Actinophytocola sp. KF-1]
MTIGTDLRRVAGGRVLEPGDDGFEQARRPWNLAVDQPVLAVVDAADAGDVAALVRYAAAEGLTITAQPSGHGATGDTEGAILLRTGALDELTVRAEDRTARVGAGVKWGQVQAVAGLHGLTGLAGSSPAVTVTGYTLGGGLSWFGRAHGLAANSVRAFDVVTADGTPARVTEDTDPELFWALRGGGGDFALVTAVEFDLHPAPSLYGGRVLWPAEHAARVLDVYRELTATAPAPLTVWFGLFTFPGGPPLVGVDVTHLGDPEEARTLLRDLDRIDGALSDTRRPMAIADLGDITAEPVDPRPGTSRTELLTALDDRVAACLLERPIAPLVTVQLRHLGGAFTRPADTAAGHIDEPYALYLYGIPGDGVRERQTALAESVGPYTTGRKPLTQLVAGEHVSSAFSPDTLARLRAVKAARDPKGVFRANFPVGD